MFIAERKLRAVKAQIEINATNAHDVSTKLFDNVELSTTEQEISYLTDFLPIKTPDGMKRMDAFIESHEAAFVSICFIILYFT